VKESSEKREEETNFRKNEENHPYLQTSFDDKGVVTLKSSFSDHVSTSDEKDKHQDGNS
jgi:hypothetical protein